MVEKPQQRWLFCPSIIDGISKQTTKLERGLVNLYDEWTKRVYTSIYELFVDGAFKKHNITTSVMSVLFVLYSLYYFYCLLKDESHINLKYYPPFWWTAGVLFFYFGSTACNVFYSKLSVITVTPKHYLTYYIYNGLNIILYGCWSYSFICRKWAVSKSNN